MNRSAFASMIGLVFFVAGCLENAPTDPTRDPEAPSVPAIDHFPLDLEHDHTKGANHKAILGLELHTHKSTGFRQIPNAPVFNFGLAKNTLVASLGSFAPQGGALAPPMGLLVADVSDPRKLEVLSVTDFPGAGVESVAISDDARFAFLGTEFFGAVGIWTVDVSDREAPQIVAFTPQPTEGPHNLRYGVIGERHFVFASVSHVATGASAAGLGQDPLPAVDLRVDVFEFDPNEPDLPMMLTSSYKAMDNEGLPNGLTIVHDAILQVHPITKQPILYVAHWDRGVRLVDLTTPESPKEIGKFVDLAPAEFLTIHTVKPAPELIEGRHLTVATSQCAYSPTAICYVRLLDTTDPTKPVQVGTWTLPDEVHGNIYTTEIFDMADGRLYVPWGHGGLWVLDISTWAHVQNPKPVGYFFPSEEPIMAGTAPFANAVVAHLGHVILADVRTGIYVLGLPDVDGATNE